MKNKNVCNPSDMKLTGITVLPYYCILFDFLIHIYVFFTAMIIYAVLYPF